MQRVLAYPKNVFCNAALFIAFDRHVVPTGPAVAVPVHLPAFRELRKKSGFHSRFTTEKRVRETEVHSCLRVAFLTRGVHSPRPAGAFQVSKSAVLLICASFLATQERRRVWAECFRELYGFRCRWVVLSFFFACSKKKQERAPTGSCEIPARALVHRAQSRMKPAFLCKAPMSKRPVRHSYKRDPESKADITGKNMHGVKIDKSSCLALCLCGDALVPD